MTKFAVPALIALIALLGGFYGGFRFGQTNASASSTGLPGTSANASPGGGGRNANPCSTTTGTGRNGANANRANVFGQVTSVAGNVVTVHNPTCNTDTKVTLSDNAAIRKTVDGSIADLTSGTDVTIQGTKNSDGTVSANNANILPAGTNFGNGASPGSGGGGGFPGGGVPGGGFPGGGG